MIFYLYHSDIHYTLCVDVFVLQAQFECQLPDSVITHFTDAKCQVPMPDRLCNSKCAWCTDRLQNLFSIYNIVYCISGPFSWDCIAHNFTGPSVLKHLFFVKYTLFEPSSP